MTCSRPMPLAVLLAIAGMLAALALFAPAPAEARSSVAVAIGDQNEATLAHPLFRQLRVRRTRYFIRWDAWYRRAERDRADRFVLAARRAGIRPLMHVSTSNFAPRRGHLPTPRQYRIAVGRLVYRYARAGVREWGVWNEANHVSQPTYRSPRRAAQYFTVLYRLCRGYCRIVALDLLDQRGVERYIAGFYRSLSPGWRRRARIVGLHNYGDVNRNRSIRTRRMMRTVLRFNRRARFWWTETGGIVDHGRGFPCNERRAAHRILYTLRLAHALRRYTQRIYLYNWQGVDCTTRFDSGLVNADGSPRLGYWAVLRYIRYFRR